MPPAGRRPVPISEKRQNLNVRMPQWLLDAVDSTARQQGLNRTEAVETALLHWIARRPNGGIGAEAA